MAGILGFGAYIPLRRLQRSAIFAANGWFSSGLAGLAKGERAMAGWDEDSITMAVAAARDCLAGFDRAYVSSVIFSSTSAPYADRQNAGVVKEALNLPDAVGSMDVGGSQRAGTTAIIQALRSVASSERRILCTGAEKRRAPAASEAELVNGDAAFALLLGEGDVVAEFIGAHSTTVDFVDRYRMADREFDYGGESRWIRDEGYIRITSQALAGAIAELGVAPNEIAHCICPMPMNGVASTLAKAVGIRPDAVADTLALKVGYAGAAHAGLMLAHVLETAKAGERILVAGFGQGCDVLLFESTGRQALLPARRGVSGYLARRREESNYMRYLVFNDLLKIDRGARAEADFKQPLTALYRSRKTVFGLVGGRCTRTGAVQFPKSQIGVDPGDHALGTQEDYPLADIPCRILTHTTDLLTYTPDPPAYYGMVEFRGGGRMLTEFADLDPAQLEVGAAMEMLFRIKEIDERRGFKRYFWKAAPSAPA